MPIGNETTFTTMATSVGNWTPNVNADPDLVFFISMSNKICIPTVAVIGLLGNFFSIWVIWSSSLRRTAVNHYLIALAASDSVFLFGLLIIWMDRLGTRIYHSRVGCPAVIFLLNNSTWISTYLVVALTVERYVVVYYPLNRLANCTIPHSRKVILCLLPVPTVFNSISVLLTLGLTPKGYCSVVAERFEAALVLNAIDSVMVLVIPFLLISGFNAAIVRRLWTDSRGGGPECQYGSAQLQPHPNAIVKTDTITLKNQRIRRRNQKKITKTLLIISTVFVAMNLPSYAIRMKNLVLIIHDRSTTFTGSDLLAEHLSNLIVYSTFAINFIVYSLSSRHFRSIAKSFVVGRLRDNRRNQLTEGRSNWDSRQRHNITANVESHWDQTKMQQ